MIGRRIVAFVCVCVVLHGAEAAAMTSRTADAETRPCASIPVELLDPIDSARVRSGDVFRFRTIETVQPVGYPEIPVDAIGYGIVEYVQSAAGHGKNGEVALEPRYITIAPGKHIDVTLDVTGSVVRSGTSRTVPSLPLPYVGMGVGAINYFHAGKNISLDAGTQFDVRPIHDLAGSATCRVIRR
jgi:hypothetical protein